MIAKIKNSNNPDIKDFTYIDIGKDFDIQQFYVNDIRYRYKNFLNQIEQKEKDCSSSLRSFIMSLIQFEAKNGRKSEVEKAINTIDCTNEKESTAAFHKILKEFNRGAALDFRIRHLMLKPEQSVTYIIHEDTLYPLGVIAEEIVDRDVFILSDNGKTIDIIKRMMY